MRNSVLLSTALFVVSFVSVGSAQESCNAVLNPNVFNSYDKTVQSKFASSAKSAMCRTEWKSEADFAQRSSRFGFNYSSFDEAFGGSGSDGRQTNSASEYYKQFCSDNHSDMNSSFFSSEKRRISDLAVLAWKECVTKRSDGLFSALVAKTDEQAIIEIRYRSKVSPMPRLILRDVTSDEVKCTLGGEPIDDVDVEQAGYNQAAGFSISCTKPKTANIHIKINTNQGDIGPFAMESKQLNDYADVRSQLQQEMSRELSKLRSQFENSMRSADIRRGPEVSCSQTWEQGGSVASCAPGEIRITGGCRFTCGNPEGSWKSWHTSSAPEGRSSWKCNAISNDPQRTYAASVVCMKPQW
jgi:hypothetical protein